VFRSLLIEARSTEHLLVQWAVQCRRATATLDWLISPNVWLDEGKNLIIEEVKAEIGIAVDDHPKRDDG
jgi:hypothetical protein